MKRFLRSAFAFLVVTALIYALVALLYTLVTNRWDAFQDAVWHFAAASYKTVMSGKGVSQNKCIKFSSECILWS
jgi:hypothetical protein